MMMKKKIGIMTWHYYPNSGSALQAYALQTCLRSLGYLPQIINYRSRKFGVYSLKFRVKRTLKYYLQKLLNNNMFSFKRVYDPFLHFTTKYLYQTRLEQREENLASLCHDFDAIICGSDQIWAPNVFNPVYMLNFAPDNISKISYAASIGLNIIPDNLRQSYRDYLQSFKKISVREQTGADLLKNNCNISAEVVLDPTLLINQCHWKNLETTKIQTDGKFIFCYFLNANHGYTDLVQEYAMRHNLKVVGYSANQNDASWITAPQDSMGPCEFLWLIHHSEAVFTDSYHGTIFSLLYHKDFITFERFANTDAICQNSRIYQLNSYFNFDARIIVASECQRINIADVDFELLNELLLY